jgi:hypothetical protein
MKFSAWDTGKSTGVVLWTPETGPWSAALPREEAEDLMVEVIPVCDHVVYERLTINEGTLRKTRDIQLAIELTGLLQYLTRVHGFVDWRKAKKGDRTVCYQAPGEAMKFATNEKLKRIGWYVPGPDHQNDARRHLLVRLAEMRAFDLTTLLPKEE